MRESGIWSITWFLLPSFNQYIESNRVEIDTEFVNYFYCTTENLSRENVSTFLLFLLWKLFPTYSAFILMGVSKGNFLKVISGFGGF